MISLAVYLEYFSEMEEVFVRWRSSDENETVDVLPQSDDYFIEEESVPTTQRRRRVTAPSPPQQRQEKKRKKKKIVCAWGEKTQPKQRETISFGPSFFVGSASSSPPKQRKRRSSNALVRDLGAVRKKRVLDAKLKSGEYPFEDRHRIDDPRPKNYVDVTVVEAGESMSLVFEHALDRFSLARSLPLGTLRVYDPLVLKVEENLHIILDTQLFESIPTNLPSPPSTSLTLEGIRRRGVLPALFAFHERQMTVADPTLPESKSQEETYSSGEKQHHAKSRRRSRLNYGK